MNVTETSLPGVLLVEPKVHRDDRGLFFETYHRDRLREAGIVDEFVQDNQSSSKRGVIRGLHYQEPNGQGKLVRCTRGALWDVAVDVREGSPHFGKWFGLELSEDNRLMLWIPKGFAHGFCTLSETADLVYKCTDYYAKESERTIVWDDPDIAIEWPIAPGEAILSDKDRAGVRLREAHLPRYA